MRLIPPPVNIGPEEGFTKDNDIFGYEQFGENMINVVAANSASEFVMLLDGSWGTGKSVFAKQWAGLLRSKSFPVIEFDAFRNDYQEDAFLAFAGEVYDLGKKNLGVKQAPVKDFLSKAKKAGAVLAPMLAKTGLRAAAAGLINTEGMGEAAKAFIGAICNDSGKAVEKIISKRLENRNSEREALDAFSTSLGELAAALSSDRKDRPLVIIVDELDRCKPTFALNILERIKHLFSTKGVVFVLVANSGQLRDTITNIYGGSAASGAKYLEKFYHARAVLPLNRIAEKTYTEYLKSLEQFNHGNIDVIPFVWSCLEEVEKAKDLPLRDVERLLTNIVLAVQSMPDLHFNLEAQIFGLCFLRYYNPENFNKALSGDLQIKHVLDDAETRNWSAEVREWFESEWRLALESETGNIPVNDRHRFREIVKLNGSHNGYDLIKSLAWRMVNFHTAVDDATVKSKKQ